MMDERFYPGNSFRYCPKCASLGTFNKDSYSFKCQSCGFNFFLNAAAAVTALIFDESGKLLMVRRGIEPAKGMLDLPGGFVDPGESAEAAIARELKEELGLIACDTKFFASFPNEYLFSGTIVNTVDLIFFCSVENLESISPNDDVASFEFHDIQKIDFDEIPFISVRNLIKKLKNQ